MPAVGRGKFRVPFTRLKLLALVLSLAMLGSLTLVLRACPRTLTGTCDRARSVNPSALLVLNRIRPLMLWFLFSRLFLRCYILKADLTRYYAIGMCSCCFRMLRPSAYPYIAFILARNWAMLRRTQFMSVANCMPPQ